MLKWLFSNRELDLGAETCDHVYIKLFFLTSQAIKARGYERLVLQVGRGSVLPAADSCPHITLEAFRFKDSIAEDVKQADLVISHAGERITNASFLTFCFAPTNKLKVEMLSVVSI